MTQLVEPLNDVPIPVWLRLTLGIIGLFFVTIGALMIWDTWTDSYVQVKTSRHDTARSYPTHANGMLPIKILISLELSGIVSMGCSLILGACRRLTFAVTVIAFSLFVLGGILFAFSRLILGLAKVFFLG